jgi:hypothetical protein
MVVEDGLCRTATAHLSGAGRDACDSNNYNPTREDFKGVDISSQVYPVRRSVKLLMRSLLNQSRDREEAVSNAAPSRALLCAGAYRVTPYLRYIR